MKLVEVKIENYKSFSTEKNILHLNDLNVIIGKNESGKSNTIEAIEEVGIIGKNSKTFFENNNRKNDEKVKVELKFKTTENEKNVAKSTKIKRYIRNDKFIDIFLLE